MKKMWKKALVVIMIGVLGLSLSGCVTGTIYGKPLDAATDAENGQGTLYVRKIMECMINDDKETLNSLGYHYKQSDAETFEEFWSTWKELEPEYGLPVTSQLSEGYEFGNELVFVAELEMEKGGQLLIQCMFTSDYEMVKAFLYETPEEFLEKTVMPEGIKEEDVVIGEGTEYPLNGKITYPESADASSTIPAVVLVGGDGANDMNMKAGNTYFYRDLAWGLAQMGIASVRYDKRTFAYMDEVSSENAPAKDFTVEWEYTEDAIRAKELLRGLSFVDSDKIYYVGHSQGAIVAPRADEEGGDFAGFVMINTSPRPWYDVIYDQYINYGLIDQDSEKIYYLVSKIKSEKSWLEDGEYNDVDEDKLTTEFAMTRPAAFWKDFLSYDYVQKLKDLQKPTLILQGGTDYQITEAVDFEAWKTELSGESFATLKSYEGLNHLMVPSKGSFAGHYKEYDMPGLASEEVITDIGQWILQGNLS